MTCGTPNGISAVGPGAVLERDFYARPTQMVAAELIGKILVFESEGRLLRGRITETEAYLGASDPASHAYRGVTPRNRVMFGPPGFSYVYFTYGFHHCFNVVTEPDGVAGAVLIRALEPLNEIELLKARRACSEIRRLTNGPGKLTQAFGMSVKHSGLDLMQDGFHLERAERDPGAEAIGRDFSCLHLGVSSRIGIREGTKSLFRFFDERSQFVSA